MKLIHVPNAVVLEAENEKENRQIRKFHKTLSDAGVDMRLRIVPRSLNRRLFVTVEE